LIDEDMIIFNEESIISKRFTIGEFYAKIINENMELRIQNRELKKQIRELKGE